MTNNALNGLYRGVPHVSNLGLGAGLGLASTKGPIADRYEDEGWTGWMKSKGGKKNSTALSALTLLAFLFFLNILQSCMDDQSYTHKNKAKGYQPWINNNGTPIIYINTNSRSSDSDDDDNLPGRKGETAELPESGSIEIDNYSIDRMDMLQLPKHGKKRKILKKKQEENKKKFEKVKIMENHKESNGH